MTLSKVGGQYGHGLGTASDFPAGRGLRRPRLHRASTLAFSFALLNLLSGAARADVLYYYDELGRLVQIVNNSGSSQYVYDAAGNIKSINTVGLSTLSVSGFVPSSGGIGSSVKIYGTGFNATPAGNTVKFNGVTATVSGGTTTSLDVVVPAGATTGTVSVNNGSGTATSAGQFTVAASLAPTITSFTPDMGSAGTALTLNGTNFQTAVSDNSLKFARVQATVNGVTGSTVINATVPSITESGKLKLTTPYGTAVSLGDFYALPSDISAASVAYKSRIVVDGAAVPVALSGTGKQAIVLFDGAKGQNLGLGYSAVSTTPTNSSIYYKVYKPDGTPLFNNYWNNANSDNVPSLPTTGTYLLSISQASTATASNVTLTVSSDATGTLVANGAPIEFNNTGRPGRNGRYTFNATAGQGVSVAMTGSTFSAGGYITVYKPNGAALISGSYFSSRIDLANLPTTGTYTVFLDPSGATTGKVSVQLWTDQTGSIAVDGAAVVANLNAGQNGRYTFSGTAGQRLGLGYTSVSTTPANQNVYYMVYKSNGTQVFSDYWSNANSNNLPALPSDDTYTLVISPAGTSTANTTVSLSSDASGTLSANGSPVVFNNAGRPGCNGRYTFYATAGQSFSVTTTGSTFGSAGTVAVYKPDGTALSGGSSSFGSRIDLASLPATGTYTVFVDPSEATTGQLNVQLWADQTGSIAIDGAAVVANLNAGQNGRYTFSGTAGQRLGLGYTSVSTTPANQNVYYVVYKSNGTQVFSDYWSNANSNNLPALPGDDTYTLVVRPAGTSTANTTVTLSSDATGTLVVGGATLLFDNTNRPGRNGRYIFSGTYGQNATIVTSGSTFSTAGTATVYKPDGTALSGGSTSFGSQIVLTNLPATGTYSIVLDPSGATTGTLSVKLQ